MLCSCIVCIQVFFFKQKTAYEMRISDWSSDVCSSDLRHVGLVQPREEPLRKLGSPEEVLRIRLAERAQALVRIALIHRSNACDRAGFEEIGRASCRERVCQYV